MFSYTTNVNVHAGFPKLRKKKKKKTAKTYTNTSDGAQKLVIRIIISIISEY